MSALSLNAYTLKWVAVVGMITNHIAIAWNTILPLWASLPLYAAGGLTYTIMAYFVVEGYRHTSNLKRYIARLLLFGVVAQAFHPMVLGATSIIPGIFLNILFTITLSLLVLLMYDKIRVRVLFWLLFVVACIVALFMDLFFMGVVVPLLYYTIKEEGRRRTLPGVINGFVWLALGLLNMIPLMMMLNTPGMEQYAHYILEQAGVSMNFVWAMPTFTIGCFVGAALIRNYNGERGRPAKWLFYVAYPVHLAVIAGISVALGLTEFSLFGF